MKFRTWMTMAVGALVLAGFVSGAEAQTAKECRQQARKICSNHDVQSDAFYACVYKKRGELPKPCQQRVVARKRLFDVCREDLAEHCQGIHRTGQLRKCISDHRSELNETCAAAVDEVVARERAKKN